MRYLQNTLLAVAFVLSLTACGGGRDSFPASKYGAEGACREFARQRISPPADVAEMTAGSVHTLRNGDYTISLFHGLDRFGNNSIKAKCQLQLTDGKWWLVELKEYGSDRG